MNLKPITQIIPIRFFLKPIVEKLDGTVEGNTRQKERTVFTGGPLTVAPIICYESIYGDFMSGYIRNGAQMIFVVTNDGWWGNTPGYLQHMSYARLRAIENRRWVIRSANTGVSCFIDPLGKVYDAQPWDLVTAIKMNIPQEDKITFFARFGDLLSRLFLVAGFVILVYSYYWRFTHKRNTR